ncbi:MAG: peptide chain release factor N(5)-glutamine methyltransferase [Balneolales bacterium]|nr:peptide chain release factor N(5)-glutamine methyltransferase [Balneolales bacterium]
MPAKTPPADWTVLSMLEWATSYFEEKGSPSPRLSIEWLLSHILQCKRLDLYLMFDRPLTTDELKELKPLILRRAKNEPLQYLTGSTDFFGLEFKTNPSALIPRPETEQLVEYILNMDLPERVRVLDIGTGTGCIPISLKTERTDWDVYACDISKETLELAQTNASTHKTDISFFEHDLFIPTLPESIIPPEAEVSFNLIVSNPPYIPEADSATIDREVKDYEPRLALFHKNIPSVYKALISLAQINLKAGGYAVFEINENLGDEILGCFPENRWETSLHKDFSEKNRFIVARHI